MSQHSSRRQKRGPDGRFLSSAANAAPSSPIEHISRRQLRGPDGRFSEEWGYLCATTPTATNGSFRDVKSDIESDIDGLKAGPSGVKGKLEKKEPVKIKLSLDKVKLWMSYSEESGDQGADPGPVITVKQTLAKAEELGLAVKRKMQIGKRRTGKGFWIVSSFSVFCHIYDWRTRCLLCSVS